MIDLSVLLFALHTGSVPLIPVVQGSFTIDGVLDEQAWETALPVDLKYETRPRENTPAPVATLVLLADTGSSLVVAFRAEDPDPSQIRAFLHDRDAAYSDDFVGVVLDTFNDERRALEFFANPYGAQMDLIQDDVNGNEDDSWNAIWSSAGVITDFGYVVELEIPYTALQLPDHEGIKTWGIDLLRFYPRAERHRLSNNPQDRSVSCYLCQLDKFEGFADANPGRDLEISPTLTIASTEFRDEVTDDDLTSNGTDIEPGLDINWGITPNVTFNGTLNPDFSQVEADVAQLDVNNTFTLFFPERRPFFLEGADFFETPINSVYTRTISDPDVGARLTGKMGRNAFGVFVADDTVTNFLVPGALNSDVATLDQSSEAAVVRYRRDVGKNSSVGVLMTHRQGDDYHNTVAGIDTRVRFSDADTMFLQYLDSDTENPQSVQEDFDLAQELSGDALRFGYDHNERDWNAYLRYDNFADGFRSDLGFITRVDYDKTVAGGGRNWWGEDDDWYTRIRWSGDWDITHDQSGRLLEKELESYLSYQGAMQSYVELGAGTRERLWDDVLFTEDFYSFFAEFQPVRGLYMSLYSRFGDQIDFANTRLGSITQIQPQIRLNVGKHWRFDVRHNNQTLERDGGTVFEANQSDIRAAYQFDLRQRLRLTIQYTDIERDPTLYVDEVDAAFRNLGTQLIYSYKVNPRTVLYAGYSDIGIETDEVADLTTTSRTLFLKVGYAWEPG